ASRLNRFHVSFPESIREELSIWDSLRTHGMVSLDVCVRSSSRERSDHSAAEEPLQNLRVALGQSLVPEGTGRVALTNRFVRLGQVEPQAFPARRDVATEAETL